MFRLPRNSYEFNTDPNKGIDYILSAIRAIQNTNVSQIIAGTNISISPVSGTGAVTINASGGTTPTLDQVTTAGNTTANAISVSSVYVDAQNGGGLYNSTYNDVYMKPTSNSWDFFVRTSSTTDQLRFSTDGTFYINSVANGLALGRLHGGNYPKAQIMMSFSSPAGYTAFGDRDGNEKMRLEGSTGNVLIGTTTDAGYKLDVNGGVKFGTGLYWDNTNNRLGIGTSNPSRSLQVVGIIKATSLIVDGVSSEGSTISLGGASVRTYTNSSNPDGYVHYITTSGSGQDRTSGVYGSYSTTHTFAPTSGTSIYNGLNIGVSINQTGGANGITRGLYVNPTLTAAADFRAIETTAGNVVFNGGNVGIGTTTPTAVLEFGDTTLGYNGYLIKTAGQLGLSQYQFKVDGQANVTGRVFVIETGSNTISKSGGVTNIYGNNGVALQTWNSGLVTGLQIAGTTGNVLIGTTTDAGYKLDVNGTARINNTLTITKPFQTGVRERLLTASVSDASGDFFFVNNGTIIDGNFAPVFGGIMTTRNDLFSLGFSGFTTATLDTTSGLYGLVDFAAMQTTNASDPLNGTLSNVTTRKLFTFRGVNNANSYLTIFAGGNVNIGTEINAGYKLDVNGTLRATGATTINNRYLYHQGDSAIQYFMTSNAWSGTNSIFFGDDSSSTIGSISYNHQFDSLSFNVNGANALFINSSRNVGIGTTAPAGPLHVKYSSSTLAGITIENDGVGFNAGSMTLRSGTTGGTNMSVTAGGGMYWFNLDTSSNTLSLPATGNLIVGGSVDAGYRLDVQGGDARFAQNVEAASYSVAGNAGYSGIINFPGNPPGSQNLEFLQGILINVF